MNRRLFLKILAQSSASIGATVFVEKVWGFPLVLPKMERSKLSVWGEGKVGITNSTTASILIPTSILRNRRFESIEAGASSYSVFFAKTHSGEILTWGNNTEYQSGPTAGTFTAPSIFGTASEWTSISIGSSHCLGIKSNGTLWAWGKNDFGQLGQGDTTTRSTPIQIGLASNWTKIAAGQSNGFAINSTGQLFGVGSQNNGSLGTGATSGGVSTLIQVGAASNWNSVASNSYASFGIKSDGTLWSWGNNGSGQLGLGNTVSVSTPTQVGVLNDWSKIFAGNEITYAIKTDGSLWAWGYNVAGELGIGSTGNRTSPVRVGTGTNWIKVAPSFAHSLALQADGSLWAWGENTKGQIGNGVTGSVVINPMQIGTSKWKDIAVVGSISAAIKK